MREAGCGRQRAFHNPHGVPRLRDGALGRAARAAKSLAACKVATRVNANVEADGSSVVSALKNAFSIWSRLAAPTPWTVRPEVRLVPPSIAR